MHLTCPTRSSRNQRLLVPRRRVVRFPIGPRRRLLGRYCNSVLIPTSILFTSAFATAASVKNGLVYHLLDITTSSRSSSGDRSTLFCLPAAVVIIPDVRGPNSLREAIDALERADGVRYLGRGGSRRRGDRSRCPCCTGRSVAPDTPLRGGLVRQVRAGSIGAVPAAWTVVVSAVSTSPMVSVVTVTTRRPAWKCGPQFVPTAAAAGVSITSLLH